MTLLIPFARRLADLRMVDAEAVMSGKDCGCVCPGCGKPVVARHCTVKTSHFAHVVTAVCDGALESSLHAAAKQAIVELGFVWLPESLAGKKMKFEFAHAEVETQRNRLRPDLTLYTKGGKPLAVEVFVTNEISTEKEEQLKSLKLACVEYHLNYVPRDLTYEELKRRFAADEVYGTWVYNKKAALAAKQRAKEMIQRIQEEEAKQCALERRQQAELQEWLRSPNAKAKELAVRMHSGYGVVTPCPIRRRGTVEQFKPLALANRDCSRCPYCVKQTAFVVTCIGHFPKLALKDGEIVRRFGGNFTKRNSDWWVDPTRSVEREPDPF